MSNKESYKILKGERNYIKRIIGQAVSRLGDSIDQITFSWIMYEVTGSASMLALVLFFNFLPTVLFQPFTAVIVERMNKKVVLAFCDIARVVMVSITLILYCLDWLSPLLLIIITLLTSTFESFMMPAAMSIMPELLPEEKYSTGIALNTTVTRIFELIGSGIAGFLISLLGVAGALIFDAAAFVISSIVNFTIDTHKAINQSKLNVKSYFSELAGGFKALLSARKVMLYTVCACAINFFLSPINSYESAYVADNLSFGAEMLSALSVAITIGLTLGSFLAPKLHALSKGRGLLLSTCIVMVATYISLWLAPNLQADIARASMAIASFLIFGLSLGVSGVIIGTEMMKAIPKEYMARISGVSGALCSVAVPLGALLCSGLAKILPVPVVFLAFAGIVLISFIAGICSKTVRHI